MTPPAVQPELSVVSGPLLCAATDAAKMLGVSRSQFWKLHSAGKLPTPVKLGARATRWRVDELKAWVSAGCPERQRWENIRENVA